MQWLGVWLESRKACLNGYEILERREFGFSEQDLLRQSATRRVRALQSVERTAARRRLSGYLLRRGFAGADVRSIVDELLPEPERS